METTTFEEKVRSRIDVIRSEAREHDHKAKELYAWANILEAGLGGRTGQTYTQHPSVTVEGY